MNKFILAFIGIFICRVAYSVPAAVDYIFDGDTFAAYVNLDSDVKISVRVRLINVDAPEINGKCESEINMAYQAKERLAQLLPVGSIVDLENIKDDKYLGRIDANAILADGRDVGDILIDEKLARPYSGGRREGWCN